MSIFARIAERQALPAGPAKPVLPPAGDGGDRAALLELRRFHLGLPGAAPESEDEAPPLPVDLVPALLHPLRDDPEAGLESPPDGAPGEGGEEGAETPPVASVEAVLRLLAGTVGERLDAARTAFRAEARRLATAVEAVLGADREKRPESREVGALGGAMGELGTRFVDPSALAGVVGRRRTAAALPPARRQRLEVARDALAAFAEGDAGPDLLIVHDDTLAAFADAGRGTYPGWRIMASHEPCGDAAELFDAEAERLARLVAAARLARLLADGTYDPERHDPWLDHLDWRGFRRVELALLPAVVALTSADHVARRGMLALSHLLLSGRPVQVVLAVRPAASPGTAPGGDPLAGFRFEPGYLGIGHREALVQQTSATRPGHMAAGFERAAHAACACLHVVAIPAEDESPLPPRLRAAAAEEGRAHPLFRYDPSAGTSWARRLDFAANPAPAEDWPRAKLAATTADGGETVLELAFTFADYALLEPAFAGHFRLAPDDLPAADLVPLADHLDLSPAEAAHKLPFIWAADRDGQLHRLIVSRRLALASRDRLGYWRTLQELAGVRNEYVLAAEARVREEVEARAREEREAAAGRHAEELEALRRGAVEEVVDRLTAALLEVDVASFASPAAAAAPLAGLGGSVEEVSAALTALAGGAGEGEDRGNGAKPADPRVDRLAAELLAAADLDHLESNDAEGSESPESAR